MPMFTKEDFRPAKDRDDSPQSKASVLRRVDTNALVLGGGLLLLLVLICLLFLVSIVFVPWAIWAIWARQMLMFMMCV